MGSQENNIKRDLISLENMNFLIQDAMKSLIHEMEVVDMKWCGMYDVGMNLAGSRPEPRIGGPPSRISRVFRAIRFPMRT